MSEPSATPLHDLVEQQIGQCSRAGDGPHWLALANRCSLIIKDQEETIAKLRGVLDGTYA